MNIAKLPPVLKAIYPFQWAFVFAFPKIHGRLRREVPVEMLRELLAMFAAQTPDDLIGSHKGVRADYDPTHGFERCRPYAEPLRTAMEGWGGALPVPEKVMRIARDIVTAYGDKHAGNWEQHEVGDDIESALIWPDSPDIPEET